MTHLKRMFLTFALFGGMFISQAQRTVVRAYPKHGTVVTTLHTSRVFVHKGARFYFADGVWYKARGRKYVVVAAPVGIKVRNLPRGNKVVAINGRKLYKYKGVWYKKTGRRYVVVNV